MQNTSNVQQGQSFIDMVCQLSGSYEDVISAAILNGKSITGTVVIGEEIKTENKLNEDVVNMFAKKRPATDISLYQAEPAEELDGIGYWIINKTFIVQ